jgi:hypothetical protein
MNLKNISKDLLSSVLAPFRPGSIAMYHLGRCGSTVLASMLRQHRNIFWASELYATVFTEWQRTHDGKEVAGELPGDALEILRSNMKKAYHRFYGFEIKPFHHRLIGYSMEEYAENLESLGFSYFIHLDRKNRMRKIISSLIAHQDSSLYHQTQKSKAKLTKVYVNTERLEIDYDSKSLMEYLDDYDKQTVDIQELLKSRNLLSLNYEEHIQEDPTIGYKKICQFLGMKPKEVKITLRRTNPFKVRDMIDNLSEVESVLKGSPYEWMLND